MGHFCAFWVCFIHLWRDVSLQICKIEPFATPVAQVGQKVELFLLSNIEQEVPVKIEEYTERLFKQQSSGEKLPKLKGGGFKTKVFGVRESGGPVG